MTNLINARLHLPNHILVIIARIINLAEILHKAFGTVRLRNAENRHIKRATGQRDALLFKELIDVVMEKFEVFIVNAKLFDMNGFRRVEMDSMLHCLHVTQI